MVLGTDAQVRRGVCTGGDDLWSGGVLVVVDSGGLHLG
jgi:hypothetical protein